MGGKIWACVQGNAPICGKANQDKTPTKAMRDFCAGQPNAAVNSLVVIGHDHPMIYDWTCKGKQPTVAKQIFTVDARGFPADLWKAIAPRIDRLSWNRLDHRDRPPRGDDAVEPQV